MSLSSGRITRTIWILCFTVAIGLMERSCMSTLIDSKGTNLVWYPMTRPQMKIKIPLKFIYSYTITIFIDKSSLFSIILSTYSHQTSSTKLFQPTPSKPRIHLTPRNLVLILTTISNMHFS